MNSLFTAQESSVATSSPRSTSTTTKLVIWIGILAIVSLAVWQWVAMALRATSGHS